MSSIWGKIQHIGKVRNKYLQVSLTWENQDKYTFVNTKKVQKSIVGFPNAFHSFSCGGFILNWVSCLK